MWTDADGGEIRYWIRYWNKGATGTDSFPVMKTSGHKMVELTVMQCWHEACLSISYKKTDICMHAMSN